MALWMTVKTGILGLAAAALLLLWVHERGRGRGLPAFFAMALLTAAGLACGFGRMKLEMWKMDDTARWILGKERESGSRGGSSDAPSDGPRAFSLSGQVATVEKTAYGYRVTVENGRIQDAREEKTVGKCFCYLDEGDGLRLGERIRVDGEAEIPESARNPGGFDYRLYCRSQGVSCLFYGDEAELLPGGRIRRLGEGIRRLRERLLERLTEIGSPQDAGILKALLLGDKSGIEDRVYETYRRNGISHLLAISGLHVSIIGMGFWNLLRKCGVSYGTSGLAAGVFLLGYGSLAGFGPSVVRAVTMMLLSFLAQCLGRTYDLPSAMCVPALGLLIKQPYLLTQAGFQLSFLAVGAVAWPGKILGQVLRRKDDRAQRPVSGPAPVPTVRRVLDQAAGQVQGQAAGQVFGQETTTRNGAGGFLATLGVSLSIQLVTAPCILYHSFELPVYGLFLNLLVIPPMTLTVLSGLLGLLLSFVSLEIGAAALGGAHFILEYNLLLCRIAESLPKASAVLGRPEAWQMAGYYGCLAVGVLSLDVLRDGRRWMGRESRKLRKSEKSMIRSVRRAVSFWALGFLLLLPIPAGGLTTTFLDVGQGDGIFLEAGKKRILIDCGSTQERELAENCLIPFLKSRGITRVDTAVVTHGDQDHMSAIRQVLEDKDSPITFGELVMPAAGLLGSEEDRAVYRELEELARFRGTGVRYLEAGDTLLAEERAEEKLRIWCLSPAGEAVSDRNEESLVFLVRYGEFSMMLTGDMGEPGERKLLERYGLGEGGVTVLKAGHHGSKTSSGEVFLAALHPSEAILSYGEGNRYGHPDREVEERLERIGARIWRTAAEGAVICWTDGKRMRMAGWYLLDL